MAEAATLYAQDDFKISVQNKDMYRGDVSRYFKASQTTSRSFNT